MEPLDSRHHCLVYEGAPSRHLAALAAVSCEKLKRNYRCIFLNSPPMVAGMRSYLAARGVDVEHEIAATNLILSSDQQHLYADCFEVQRMLGTLKDALERSLNDGYAGLWASGDMTWEMGPRSDFSRLLEYEWMLEDFLRENAEMSGVCQYHADSMPREAVRQGLTVHRSLFVNETLSMLNPYYIPRGLNQENAQNSDIDSAVLRLCQSDATE